MYSPRYDAIIVGARCAGAPTAMQLARKGLRVLLLDRTSFPSDIPHGHFIHRDGPRTLARWGVLDRLSGCCPPVTAFTLDLGDFPLTGRDLVVDGVAFGYAPRRAALDKVLVEAAVDAGAELRERVVVEAPLWEDGRVVGIRARLANGDAIEERAPVTIGADGRHSRLAAGVGAPMYDAVLAVTCWYFSYWSGVRSEGLEVYVGTDRMIFAFPTGGGLFAIFVAAPAAALPTLRADLDAGVMAAIDAIPEFSARVRAGRREERFQGATDLPNFFRKPYGPGWALVGDAGCHKDPCLALGICDAFRDVDLLVDAVDEALSGRASWDAALAGYERQRNDLGRGDYWQNLSGARFERPPDAAFAARASIRADVHATRQFFLAREGMVPRPLPSGMRR
jgi:flavin-dependent dehydrogenase